MKVRRFLMQKTKRKTYVFRHGFRAETETKSATDFAVLTAAAPATLSGLRPRDDRAEGPEGRTIRGVCG
ncbi:MAG TPA: hypothetical protein DIU07_06455 [Rhodobacteraceae bacterium]|nr:hypothetical protein [Paracoccaceae bacterium]